MTKSARAVAISALAALPAIDCNSSPAAPVAPALNLSGMWSGDGSDTQGRVNLTLTLAQSGTKLTGTAVTRAADAADGSCASCHKNKAGTLTGEVLGSSILMKILFPTGGDVPTPICSVTINATSSQINGATIPMTYSGEDSCEGPFADGAVMISRRLAVLRPITLSR